MKKMNCEHGPIFIGMDPGNQSYKTFVRQHRRRTFDQGSLT